MEVARDAGASASYLVDNATYLKEEWLEGVTTIGVSSGASVPEILVRELLERLATYGFTDVEEVETERENITFALPRELRTRRSKNDKSLVGKPLPFSPSLAFTTDCCNHGVAWC